MMERPACSWQLIRALAAEHYRNGQQKQFDVVPKGLLLNIFQIHLYHLIERDPAAPMYLPESGYPRERIQPPQMPGLVESNLIRDRWARPNQAHLSPQYIEKLRQFINTGPPQEIAERRDTRITGRPEALDLLCSPAC